MNECNRQLSELKDESLKGSSTMHAFKEEIAKQHLVMSDRGDIKLVEESIRQINLRISELHNNSESMNQTQHLEQDLGTIKNKMNEI